jgi:alkylation response protein AidB-like acyl-CoA dehydrogenase
VWTFTFQRRIRRSLERVVRLSRMGGKRAPVRDALTRQKLAQSFIEVALLKFIGYRSLTHLLRTGHPGPESSLEKIAGSETDQRLQETAMQILGAFGSVEQAYIPEVHDIGREFLYSRSETIMGGTSEIQRNVIAQRILGLPR